MDIGAVYWMLFCLSVCAGGILAWIHDQHPRRSSIAAVWLRRAFRVLGFSVALYIIVASVYSLAWFFFVKGISS